MPELHHFFSSDSIFWALIENAALLIALAYLHSLLPPKESRRTISAELVLGFLVGLVGVTVITAAYQFRDGIIFDTRSIVIGVTGLFFGVIPTTVAMILTSVYRWWQGGTVAGIGIAVIFASGLLGLAWRRFLHPDLAKIRWGQLFAFGYTVHLVMLASFLAFPSSVMRDVFALVTIPVLGIYPLVTAVLGKLLSIRLQRLNDARQLRENEERFELIFKGANDGWWDWDLERDAITYSPRWWEMLGLEPGSAVATPGLRWELMHPEDRQRAEYLLAKILSSDREKYEIEVRLRHQAGHYISVVSRGHIQRNADGRAVRVSGTDLDITPMRHALDSANASKALLEAAGRIGRIGYWEIAFEGPSLFWSDITAEIHDLPPGTQVSLDDAMSFFPAEYQEQIKKDANELRIHGKPFTTEYQIITARGRRIWVQARGEPVRAVDGRIIGMRGVFQDIDKQKRSAEALRRSESNYREIFNASSDAIFIHEESTGKLLDVNEAMIRMYGYPDKASALTSTIVDLSSGEPPYDEAGVREQERITLEQGHHTFPWRARRVDGSTFWVEVSLRRTKIGGEGRILVSVRDISKRRALEARVREAEKMESLGRLAGGIAHDFNNMLGVIIGHADLADHRGRLGLPIAEELDQIRNAAERSAELVRQLLAFARQQVIVPKVIDLNRSMESTLTMLDRLIDDRVSLEWKPGDRLWPVKIDPVQVDQILTNLVLNARDAIDGTGTVSISTENEERAEGDWVKIKMSDTGCGMNADTLRHIFEPFFTTKPVGRGTGLGLATVYGIVEQNGGSIEVTSLPTQGTTFVIRLPRHRPGEESGSSEPSGASPGARAGKEILLLVEDEPAILQLASRALELHGYSVLPVAHPEEALAIASDTEQTIDMVISDMIMPGMNGRELRSRVLSLRPSLKFLFVSGYTDGHDIGMPEDPSVDFLGKPFAAAALAEKVREMLDAARNAGNSRDPARGPDPDGPSRGNASTGLPV